MSWEAPMSCAVPMEAAGRWAAHSVGRAFSGPWHSVRTHRESGTAKLHTDP